MDQVVRHARADSSIIEAGFDFEGESGLADNDELEHDLQALNEAGEADGAACAPGAPPPQSSGILNKK